jgi:hypothetical protein
MADTVHNQPYLIYSRDECTRRDSLSQRTTHSGDRSLDHDARAIACGPGSHRGTGGEENASGLCERIERFLPELFLFVAVPGVPSHNNLAECRVRPLVIARKISGGSRSPKGSHTRMSLASLFSIWMAQGLNPFRECLDLLSQPSPLPQT